MINFLSVRSCYHKCYLPSYYEEYYDEEDQEGDRVPVELEFELIQSHVCYELAIYHEGWQYAKETIYQYLDQTIGSEFPTGAWGEVKGYRWNKKGPNRRLANEAAELIHFKAEIIQTNYKEYLERRMKKRVFVHRFVPFFDCALMISQFV